VSAAGGIECHHGDCLAVLPTLAADSIDACITDPPYHLQSIVKRFAKTGRTDKTRSRSGPHQRTANGFMNKQWDGGAIAFDAATWAAVLRVLKPGAYIAAFSSTRTFARMAVAIEDAGFITHPFIAWIFGQGFPKAHRVHDDAWEGWRYGTQSLKPAIEPIYIGQKPFEPGLTGTENVRKWGTGAINIDGCRVPSADAAVPRGGEATAGKAYAASGATNFAAKPGMRRGVSNGGDALGRWPANVILDGSAEVLAAFPEAPGQQRRVGPDHGDKTSHGIYGDYGPRNEHAPRADHGSAARFFYTAKADRHERLGSKHPTVKPLDLIAYLIRLLTPPGGIVLDPFAGTGTTAEAAFNEHMRAVLIEREAEYVADIHRRIALMRAGRDERIRQVAKAKAADRPPDHGPLFA
jgi:site-specific DNA-methyltransferase (adenine-specific)